MAMQSEQKTVAVKPGEQQQGREMSRSSSATGMRPRRPDYSPFGMTPFDILRANPFSIFRRMSDEMDRMFHEQMWEGAAAAQKGWSPAIEVSQRDGKFNIQAELPGLEPNDVKVEIENDSVVIHGERKSESEQKTEGMHRTERQYGYFYRSIPLPEGTNADQAQAKFRNGVLEVTVPMSEQASNKRSIPVQAEGTQPPKPTQSQAA